MSDTEIRFATTMREEDRDEPGLVLESDGTISVVKPGGARRLLAGASALKTTVTYADLVRRPASDPFYEGGNWDADNDAFAPLVDIAAGQMILVMGLVVAEGFDDSGPVSQNTAQIVDHTNSYAFVFKGWTQFQSPTPEVGTGLVESLWDTGSMAPVRTLIDQTLYFFVPNFAGDGAAGAADVYYFLFD